MTRTIDDFGKPGSKRHAREIDDDETLRIVEDKDDTEFLTDDDETDPGDRRRDPLRQPY